MYILWVQTMYDMYLPSRVIGFTTLKILCDAPIHPFLPPPLNSWQAPVFLVSMVLSFPEHHVVGIIRYVAFPIGFFHLVTCV